MAEIGEQVKQIAAFVGGIVVLALYAVSLLAIGGTLFLGEWLFGSIGWGVLHGVLLAVGIIVSLALLIIEAPRPLLTRPLAWGVGVGIVTTLVLGFNVPRNLSEWAADLVISRGVALDPQYAPAVVAMVVFALVFAIVGLYLGARSEGGLGAIQGLVVGALVGALFGLLFGGLVFSWQPAAAIGVTVGLIVWIALMGWRASKANLDPQARFEKLWPRETYATALETKAWLEEEWTKRLPRPGSR
jgi:NADH:ubiquinone oxidoreductase subunit 6 (subunit J)